LKALKLVVAVSMLVSSTGAFAQALAPQPTLPAASMPAAKERSAEERSASGGQTNGPDMRSRGMVGPFGLGVVGTLAVVAGVIVLIAAATDGGDSKPTAQH
jgi:hypothetical protein